MPFSSTVNVHAQFVAVTSSETSARDFLMSEGLPALINLLQYISLWEAHGAKGVQQANLPIYYIGGALVATGLQLLAAVAFSAARRLPF